MAKRVRGSVRPGQRPPAQRRTSASGSAAAAPRVPVVAPRPSGLTEAETARAAELEAQLLAEERAAEAARSRTRQRPTTARDALPGGGLGVRAEEEYAYVARDVKRIVRVGSLLVAILLALWVVIDVARIVPIG